MGAGAAIGAAAAQQGMSAATAFGISAFDNWLARKREAEARAENYKYGEMAAGNADKRTRALFTDLYAPSAQMRQIREAGLSPSLLASEGAGVGGSGQAGAQGQGASGISPTIFGVDPLAMAQINLMNAQARKQNSDADKNEGKNAMGIAKIAELYSSAGAKDAAAELNKAEKTNIDIKNYVDNESKDFNVRYLQYLAEKSFNETKKAGFEAEREGIALKFDKDTYNQRIQEQTERINNIIANTAEKMSNVKLNNEEIKLIQAKVTQTFKEIEFRASEVATQHSQWRTYDELVVNEIGKMWRDTDIQRKSNEIKELGVYLDLIATIIGSVAHVAGMSK